MPTLSAGAALQALPFAFTPPQLDFGDVVVFQKETMVLTARNTTTNSLTVTDVDLVSNVFEIVEDRCRGRVVPTQGTCTVRVAFRPVEAASFRATLKFGTATSSQTVLVTGRGVTGVTSIAPTTTTSITTTTTTTTNTTTTTRPSSAAALVLGSTATETSTTSPGTTTSRPPASTIPTTAVVDDATRLEQCEQEAKSAKVAYEPTRTMRLEETSQIRVMASIERPGQPRTSRRPTGSTSTTVEQVQLRCEVQAQLRSLDFTIEPKEFQHGSFLDRPVVEWSWDVVPLKTGRKVLTLEIRSVAETGGRRIPGAGTYLYDTTITVDATPESFLDRSERVSRRVVEHPLVQGLASLLLLGGTLAGAWKWLLKRPLPWKGRAS